MEVSEKELNHHIYPINYKKKEVRKGQTDLYVEVKSGRRHGKCFGAPKIMEWEFRKKEPTDPGQLCYNTISNDIWYLISEFIPPEDIKTFALICTQTAAIVSTCKFWKHIYFRYCQKSSTSEMWNLQLPPHLQYENIVKNCDRKSLRHLVIESFFYCYTPLAKRIKQGYSLDALLGFTYIASWHLQYQCIWIMCYKFWHKVSRKSEKRETAASLLATSEVVNDWECLATIAEETYNFRNPNEGISLLIICCNRFIPFPSQLLYENEGDSQVRLASTRQMVTKDMRGSNLEIDFIDGVSKATTTIKYPHIIKYKVLPWWHPDFKKFNK